VLLYFRVYLGFLRETELLAWQYFATCHAHASAVSGRVRRASHGPTISHLLSEHLSAFLPRRAAALRVLCGYYRINQELWATIDRVAQRAAVSCPRCGDRGTVNP